MLAQAMKANLINTTQISNSNNTAATQSKKKPSEGMLSYGIPEQQQVFQNVIFNNKAPLSAHNQDVLYGRK